MTVRQRFLLSGGTITDNPLTSAATVFNSSALANLPAVSSPAIAAVTIYDPTGVAGAPEVVWITAHSSGATTATIVRAQEGTSARSHSAGESWVHGPTPEDFGLTAASQPSGDFQGERYFDTTTNQRYDYDGSDWKSQADEGLTFMGGF